jgi:hypothetical protein
MMQVQEFRESVALHAKALTELGAEKYRRSFNDDDWYLVREDGAVMQQVGCSTIMARCIAHGQEEDGGTWMRGMAAKSKIFPL